MKDRVKLHLPPILHLHRQTGKACSGGGLEYALMSGRSISIHPPSPSYLLYRPTSGT